MKKQYYILLITAIIAILSLQVIHINSLYRNFRLTEEQNIDRAVYEAIGLELHHRIIKRQNPNSEVEYTRGAVRSSTYKKSVGFSIEDLPLELRVPMQRFLDENVAKPDPTMYSIP